MPASATSAASGAGTRHGAHAGAERARAAAGASSAATGTSVNAGIAVPARAIGEALRHRAGEEVEGRRRAGAEGGEVVAREDAEHLEHDAAGARRREGDDPAAAEAGRRAACATRGR